MNRWVRMFAVSVVASAAFATAGWAQNPQEFISWGAIAACPTITTNTNFVQGTTSYPMYIGCKNLTASDANVGTFTQIWYGPNVPDAWRMDDAGCQTTSQATIANAGSKTCPILKGASPLVITNFFYDTSTNRMSLQLSIAYDTFTPASGITYTLWTLVFDHSFSVTGPGSPPTNCGGADLPVCFSIANPSDPGASYLLNTLNEHENFTFANPSDQFVTWNSAAGCPGSVPTQPSTWGRIKGLYH